MIALIVRMTLLNKLIARAEFADIAMLRILLSEVVCLVLVKL
jgi:hypothetical protein